MDASKRSGAVAVVGRPNVGKSTLVNRLLGEERMIASEVPGTTRDSIAVDLERDGRKYRLIDTAGLRRKSKVDEAVEKRLAAAGRIPPKGKGDTKSTGSMNDLIRSAVRR